jgi:hypothetical protein
VVNPLRKLVAALRPKPKSPEEYADEAEAKAEAHRIEDRNLDVRLSQRSVAGENYQSGRDSL